MFFCVDWLLGLSASAPALGNGSLLRLESRPPARNDRASTLAAGAARFVHRPGPPCPIKKHGAGRLHPGVSSPFSPGGATNQRARPPRSEERRVGKECGRTC